MRMRRTVVAILVAGVCGFVVLGSVSLASAQDTKGGKLRPYPGQERMQNAVAGELPPEAANSQTLLTGEGAPPGTSSLMPSSRMPGNSGLVDARAGESSDAKAQRE